VSQEEEEEDDEAEEITEKVKPILLSMEKVEILCKCWSESKKFTLKIHTKEVFSDGWTRFVCSRCGQVKFKRGKEAEAE